MKYQRLNREFFKRDTKKVAEELLGKYLIRKTEKGNMVGKIIEVEAYLGLSDKACHSYNYKKTNRTKVMYEKPGIFYIYLIYGMYYCLNVITEPEGIPCAVLIRKIFPIDGIDLMLENRKAKMSKNYKNLLDGPGKLCMGYNITEKLFNGKDSCSLDATLFFTEGESFNKKEIILQKRIGIDYAKEDKDRLLRFSTANY